METRKHLCSLARMVLPGLGFALISVGAYLVSLRDQYNYTPRVILAYVLIACGFLSLLSGVFWTMCHGMKSKRFLQRERSRHHHNAAHVDVYTIDRPSFYPPSYDESQQSTASPCPVTVVTVNEERLWFNLAPPLYTQDSSEAPDDTFSHEEPPPYTPTIHSEEAEEVAP